MSRGFKSGPFGAMKTARTTSGHFAVGIAPCSIKTCGHELPVRVNGSGWFYTYCSVKTGCGHKQEYLGKEASADVISRVTIWAIEGEGQTNATKLCDAINLYPTASKVAGFDARKPAPVKPEAAKPAPQIVEKAPVTVSDDDEGFL